MSVPRAEQTFHIFRTPRWAIPDYILGIDYTRPFFARFGSDMMPSWHYSWSLQRMLHGPLSFIVDSFWKVLCRLFWFQHVRNAKLGDKDISVLDIVKPPASQFRKDLRSAALVAPNRYFEYLAHGKIEAKHAQVQSFTEDGIVLSTGETIKVDVVCVCCGNQPQSYSFLPEAYRQVLTNKRGGASLYRFAVDPRIPDLGFNIVNCFLQLAFCHLSTLWQVAVHEGQIQLPSEHTMLEEAQCVARWKSDHSAFEPSANSSVNTRFQQMLDLLCQDLGLNMWRKMPNVFAEIFLRYDPTDYAGVIDEYLTKTRKKNLAGPPSVPQLMTCMLDKKKKERTAKGGRSSIQKPVEEHPLLQHSAVSTSDEKRSFASRIDSAAWEVP
jgi:dimethylaniline monooxygenase (N-oxide forming)